jgi:3',5'-cyclic AMP phosphodiesterase CpdA
VLVSSFSQHPSAERVLVHVSDTHLLDGRALYGSIDSDTPLRRLLERLVASGGQVDALVFTGDLADRGERGAYRRLRDLVEPFALKLGAAVVWVMGNHDEREPFSEVLFDGPTTAEPQDRVIDIDGLRLIALDTSVPGYHHGELTPAQLEWLASELATPAPRGTILALHHPPIPMPVELMGLLELEDQASLARVIEGTDVRALLAGHLHYSTFSTFAGVPVSVCAASCYNIDLLGVEGTLLSAVPGGLSASLVHIYPDQVVFSTVPLDDSAEITHYDAAGLAGIAAMTKEQRREMFSNKNSDFNRASDQKQSGF